MNDKATCLFLDDMTAGEKIDNDKLMELFANAPKRTYGGECVILHGDLSCDSDLPYDTSYMQGIDEVVEYDTIGEYLGKDDINGKKLFEGDIVKCVLNHNQKKCIGVSEYSTLNAEYMISTTSSSFLPFAMFYQHEIVGNKWDNPELLTNKT